MRTTANSRNTPQAVSGDRLHSDTAQAPPLGASRIQHARAWASGHSRGERTPPERPYAGVAGLRVLLSVMLSALSLLTVGSAVVLLMLWQQDVDNGVLTTQLDRAWSFLEIVQGVERWIAFGAVAAAMAWIMVATINARRATGRRRNAVVAMLSLPVGLVAVWLIGSEINDRPGDTMAQTIGWVLQCAMLAIPVIFLERVAIAAEARARPLRAVLLMASLYLASLQFYAGLSTVERDVVGADWGRYGAYLLISGLIQIVGALAVADAARAIEDGAHQRFELRSRFSETLLAHAAVT